MGCSGDDDMKIKLGDIKISTKVDVLNFDYLKEFEQEKELKDDSLIKELKIMLNVGNVKVFQNHNDKIQISVVYNVSTMDKKDFECILNLTELKVTQENGTLGISINKKDSNENIWDWLEETMKKKYNLSANISIGLPRTFEKYDICVDTGSITIEKLEGSFKLKTDTGNLLADEIVFRDECVLKTDTGNIEVGLKEKGANNEANIKIYADTGNIFLLTNDMEYENILNNKKSTRKNIRINNKWEICAEIDTGQIIIK